MSARPVRAGLAHVCCWLAVLAGSAASAAPSQEASAAASTAAAGSAAASAPKAAVKSPARVAKAASVPKAASASAAASTATTAAAPGAAAASKVAAAKPGPANAPATLPAVAVPANPCDLLVKRMPNLSSALCDEAMLQASGSRSVNGFPLYQRDLSAHLHDVLPPDGSKPPRRLRVLVIGGIHGDELSSTSLVFHWIAHALETGADMEWRFVPALNPDGLMQLHPTRTNARGVDLNRNFPTPNWDQEAPEYWAKRTKKDPRRYPGPTPLSEPETRFLQETMDRWKPDLIVSVHAPYGVLDYDGPSVPPEKLGRLFLDRVGIFPGSLGHYGGVHRGVPVVTIELPSAIRTPTNAEMRQMWIDLLRWIGERLSVTER